MERPIRAVAGRQYRRFVIRTHLIAMGESLEETLWPYFADRIKPGDIVVLSEKIVAISQRRAVPLNEVQVRPLARWLASHVRPMGYGLGLRRPETMEMAIREGGTGRILFAAGVGALDRLLGRSGDFYRVAGRNVAAIDGPGPSTIPPYNQFIVLAPQNSADLAKRWSARWRTRVAVVDVNDVGSEVLGASPGVDIALVRELLRDNPMGQGAERTPVGVLRRAGRVPRFPRGLLPSSSGSGWIYPEAGIGDSQSLSLGESFKSDGSN